MLFSMCVHWLSVRTNCVCVCTLRLTAVSICETRPFPRHRVTATWTFWHYDAVCVCCECRKTPILAAIKRSISIVLKLAFSLRFSFKSPLFQLFTLASMVRCCYTITIATKSSLHFGFALLSFRFVIAYFLSRFFSSFSVMRVFCLRPENDNSVSVYFISSKEHWH